MTPADRHLQKAKDTVFRLLKLRLRSEKEVHDKLKSKGFEEEIIEKTIEYFKEIELVNDRVFAQKWISFRLNKPFGFTRIKKELKEKGVEEDIVHEELAKVDDYQELDVVKRIIERRGKIYKGIDKNKLKQRLFGYLIRRGFSSGSVYKALREI